jgi:hypothetical protein
VRSYDPRSWHLSSERLQTVLNRQMRPPLICNSEASGRWRSAWQKWPAAARNLIPLSRFPQGQAGAGRVPPTPKHAACQQKNAGTHRCCRLPPQEGCCPLVHPPLSSGVGLGRNEDTRERPTKERSSNKRLDTDQPSHGRGDKIRGEPDCDAKSGPVLGGRRDARIGESAQRLYRKT